MDTIYIIRYKVDPNTICGEAVIHVGA